MRRREFLGGSAALAAFGPGALADDVPGDLRVTRVVGFTLTSTRPKEIGANSHLPPRGRVIRDPMVRILTNAGIEGLGRCKAPQRELAKLLGTNPLALHRAEKHRMAGPLGTQTMPLWDLAGKALGKPVYELLGGAGPKTVGVYDGSIYLSDLLPKYAKNWADHLREEIDMGRKIGHNAFKIKVGRGFRWMKRDAGDRRDAEVVRTIRKHGGKDITIGIDANNGYDPAGTKKLLEKIGGLNIAFAEEMFPENIEQYLDLKAFLRSHNWKTLIADGETQKKLDPLRPFMKAKAVDLYQLDMNRMGCEGILEEADACRPHGGRVAPHNWGSLVGFYAQLHVGKAIDNFYLAEHDPAANDVLIAEGYAIRDGRATVPDAPGFGLKLNEKAFGESVRVQFDLKLSRQRRPGRKREK